MSGLCGCVGRASENRSGVLAMARALSRLDAIPVHQLSASDGCVAVAAMPDGFSLYSKDGLMVAIWGRPTLDRERSELAARFAERWREQGTKACVALSGHFAVSVIDTVNDEVTLAIDRSGVHTMHYQRVPEGLLFSSSAAALQAHPSASAELDPQALYDYLYFHTIPAPRSVYRNQQRLLPGEYLQYRAGRLDRGHYWKMSFREQPSLPFADLREQFLAAVRGSVEQASEERVGAFLSGGTDSSTLAGILAEVRGEAPHTFSIGFDVPGYDEMAYARIASQHFHTVHHEYYVNAGDVLAAVPRIAAACDQPFGNASIVPAYYCARIARTSGMARLLGGDGGDELFGGNERYAKQALFAYYERVPSALRQLALEPLLFGVLGSSNLAMLNKARSYVRQALVQMPARLESYNLLQRHGPAQILCADFLHAVDASDPLSQLHACYWEERDLSQINRMQALDLRYTLADNDLRKVSLACEMAGVEAAFPLLSDELLAFSAHLPPSYKLKGTTLRHFFKRALRQHLPREILRKKKHGFGLPFGHWLQTDARLRDFAFDSLVSLKARAIVKADFIDHLTGKLLPEHPAYHGTMVWVLMMLEQWLHHHVKPACSGSPSDAEETVAGLVPRA